MFVRRLKAFWIVWLRNWEKYAHAEMVVLNINRRHIKHFWYNWNIKDFEITLNNFDGNFFSKKR